MLVAEFSKGDKRGPKAWLDLNIIQDGRRSHVETVGVSGKVEARRIANARGAKCWNF